MLSQQAFNALLKTLEEPPEHVKFIFATTESHKVLPTIISRCQDSSSVQFLADLITGKHKKFVSQVNRCWKSALKVVSRMAMGGMRDAQSILDQMISFCGKKITQADVLEVYGLVSHDRIQSFSNFILDEIMTKLFGFQIHYLKKASIFTGHFSTCQRILGIFYWNYSEIKANFNSSPEQCVRILDVFEMGEDLVRMGLSEKTNFEVTLFRAIEAGRTRSIDQVIRKISGDDPKRKKKQ